MADADGRRVDVRSSVSPQPCPSGRVVACGDLRLLLSLDPTVRHCPPGSPVTTFSFGPQVRHRRPRVSVMFREDDCPGPAARRAVRGWRHGRVRPGLRPPERGPGRHRRGQRRRPARSWSTGSSARRSWPTQVDDAVGAHACARRQGRAAHRGAPTTCGAGRSCATTTPATGRATCDGARCGGSTPRRWPGSCGMPGTGERRSPASRPSSEEGTWA